MLDVQMFGSKTWQRHQRDRQQKNQNSREKSDVLHNGIVSDKAPQSIRKNGQNSLLWNVKRQPSGSYGFHSAANSLEPPESRKPIT
jgi:hypothetical protein